MKKRTILLCMSALIAIFATGCSNQTDTSVQDASSPPAVSQEEQATLEDGVYSRIGAFIFSDDTIQTEFHFSTGSDIHIQVHT